MKQFSSSGGWVGTSSYSRSASGWKLGSGKSHCTQPRAFVYRPIWSPGTESQQRRRREPSPSLIRKHQKTDRGAAGGRFPAGEDHLSASVQLTNPFFINCLSFCYSQNTTRQRWDEPQLMNAFITGTPVTSWCSLEGGKTVRRGKKAPQLFPWSEPPPCDKFHTLLREIRWGFRFPSLSHAVAEYREINSFCR